MPVTSCVAEVTVPLPVTGVPPPSLLTVYEYVAPTSASAKVKPADGRRLGVQRGLVGRDRVAGSGPSGRAVAVAVAGAPVPVPLLSVTLKVSVPSGSEETSMPVTSWVAEVTVPLPVTGVPPPSLLTV